MKRKLALMMVLAMGLAVSLAVLVGLSAAQGPAPEGALGTAFTY